MHKYVQCPENWKKFPKLSHSHISQSEFPFEIRIISIKIIDA